MNNMVLAIIAIILGVLSVLTYSIQHAPAERFEIGQKLLPSLNLDNVASIELKGKAPGADGKGTVSLTRSGDAFTIASEEGYPATNKSLNALFNKLAEIKLAADVGAADDDERNQDLEVDPSVESCSECVLRDSEKTELVHLYLGKSAPEGGIYVRRKSGDSDHIFISESWVSLDYAASKYYAPVIEIPKEDVVAVRGEDFELKRESEGGELVLQDIPEDHKVLDYKLRRVKEMLTGSNWQPGLTAKQVYVADNAEVANLKFDVKRVYDLKSFASYTLHVAKKDPEGDQGKARYFVRLEASLDVKAAQAKLDAIEDKDEQQVELRKFKRLQLDQEEFKAQHQAWVYELNTYDGEALMHGKSDFIELEKKPEPTPAADTEKPGGAKPGGAKPDGAKPDGAKPDGSKPDGAKPDGSKPDGAKPDGAKPGGAKPDGAKPVVPKPAAPKADGAGKAGDGKADGSKPTGTPVPSAAKPKTTSPPDSGDAGGQR